MPRMPSAPRLPLLRRLLAVLAVGVSVAAVIDTLFGLPHGVDLEIPLRAVDRWLAGGVPYEPESFGRGIGVGLPFLYPPYALPLFAPLAVLPRLAVHVAWFAGLLGASVFALRRLGFTWRWVPWVLAWPPFSEALIVENVQLFIFAAWVLLLVPPLDDDDDPRDRSLVARRGLLGALTALLKVSQPHSIVRQLRWDRRAAVVGLAALVLVVLITLPFTGSALWSDWLDQ